MTSPGSKSSDTDAPAEPRSGYVPADGVPKYGVSGNGSAWVGWAAAFAGAIGLVAYGVAEGLFLSHPLHWVMAVAGGIVGFGGGALVFNIRERRRWR